MQFLELVTKLRIKLLLFLAFLLPLFFLPVTSEFYEFNKQILLFVVVLTLFILWTLGFFLEKKVKITRTPLDLALILFIGVYVLATITSKDPFISIAGAHPRFHLSLASIIAFGLLFFIASSTILKKHTVQLLILLTISSVTLASLIFLVSTLGLIPLPQIFEGSIPFSTIGISNNLGLLSLIVLPFVVWLYNLQRHYYKILAIAATVILVGTISILNIPSLWIVFGFLTLFTLSATTLGMFKKSSLVLGLVALIVIVFTNLGILQTVIPSFNPKNSLKIETLGFLSSWRIASRTLGDQPFLGTGPGTFAYDFLLYKPVSLNNSQIGNIRFDRPSSDFFEFLTTIGILGTVAFLFFLGKTLHFGRILYKHFSREKDSLGVSLLLSLAVSCISFFFLSSSTASFAFFVIILSLLVALAREYRESQISEVSLSLVALREGGIIVLPAKTRETTSSHLSTVVFIASLVIVAFGSYLIFRVYTAEIFYRRALVALNQNKASQAISNLRLSILSNPYRDVYHRAASQTSLALVQGLAAKKDLNDQEKQALGQLIEVAINEGKTAAGYRQRAIAGTSNLNVRNWENLTQVYLSLTGSIKDAEVHAINTLLQAINLDPTNSALREVLGNLLLSQNRKEEAQKIFENAVAIDPQDASTHYNLARILRERGSQEEAVVRELSLALRFLPENDPNRNRLQSELEEAKEKLQKKPAQNQAPSPSPSPLSTP